MITTPFRTTFPEDTVARYEAGETVQKIASRLGTGQPAVVSFLLINGVELRVMKGRPRKQAPDCIVEEYKSGMSVPQIRVRHGLSDQCIYTKLLMHGIRTVKRIPPVHVRLNRYSDQVASGCIEWRRNTTPTGYGKLTVNKKTELAHRLAYLEFVGDIPDELWVLHRCDNPRCINVHHLFLGTPKDNSMDCVNKDRNGRAKLTVSQVQEMRSSFAAGVSRRELSRLYGVTWCTASNIVNFQTWRTVPC